MNLQFFGGRGGASGLTDWLSKEGGNTGGTPEPIDISQFKDWSLEQIEDRIRNLSHEELFVLDENDNLVAAYRGNSTEVAFPATLLQGKDYTVTHGHPKGAAEFGGTFSFADVKNMLNSDWKEHRATASGQGEMNYILRKGKNADSKAFYNQINRDYQKLKSDINNTSNKAYKQALDNGASKKHAAHIARQSGVGVLNAYWKKTAPKFGYEFITRKEGYRYNR